MIAEAMQKVNRRITVEEAKAPTPRSRSSRACSSTAAISRPISSPTPKMVADLEDAYILPHEKKLSGLQAMRRCSRRSCSPASPR
jgi:hypothetical protein